MHDAYMQYESDDGSETAFRWYGGAYVEVGWLDHGVFQPHDIAANVYDYAAGAPMITTLAEFAQICRDYQALCPACRECPCECAD